MTEKTSVVPMHNRQFGLSEFKARRWRGELDENQTVKDALDQTFWRHQADMLMGHDKAHGRGDIIELFKPDTSEYVELLVVEIGRGFVKTRLISHASPEAIDIPDDVPFTTRWNVGRRCHEVVRRADGIVMQSGYQTKASAAEWIKDHLRAMAA